MNIMHGCYGICFNRPMRAKHVVHERECILYLLVDHLFIMLMYNLSREKLVLLAPLDLLVPLVTRGHPDPQDRREYKDLGDQP